MTSSSRSNEGPHSSIRSIDLTHQIILEHNGPASCGGYADVYRGVWKAGSAEKKVAIKALRLYHLHDEEQKKKIIKRLKRELRIWQRCEHDNILPLYGVTSHYGSLYSMVCPWMEHGNINDYLKNYNPTLRLDERFLLLCGVAAGLGYLHSQSIVHGDLTGANVLIDDDRKARLSDFGLSQVMSEVQGSSYFTSTVTGAYRWSAPELYSFDDDYVPTVNISCDLYSFGSIMLQILSGKVPYHSIKTDTTIRLYLKEGRKPDRPTEITIDNHWNLIRKCWADVPAARPAADILSQDLKRFHLESEREHTLRRKAPQMQTADSEGLKRGRRKRIKLVVTEKSDVAHPAPVTAAAVSGPCERTDRLASVGTFQVISKPLEGQIDKVTSVAFSPNGKYIVSGSWDWIVRVWDAETYQVSGPFTRHTDMVRSVAFSPDSKYIVSGSNDGRMIVWGAETGQVEVISGPFKGGRGKNVVSSVAFSPSGKHIVAGCGDSKIRICDAQTGEVVSGPFIGHDHFITSVAFSPDGKLIVSGSYDRMIQVWDAEVGKVISGPFTGHTGSVDSVAFSPDGERVASGSTDKTIHVWDVKTGKVISRLYKGDMEAVCSVAFSPDSKHIVSGSTDRTIRVWDAETGQVVSHPLRGHTSLISSVAFSPDGKHIVTGSHDKTIRVWDVDIS